MPKTSAPGSRWEQFHTVRLDKPLWEAMTEAAKAEDRRPTNMIHRALKEWLREHGHDGRL
ncbi:hypothetical protein ACFWP3_04330 [Streptomyces sp. NPDC058525]|uniref:hypothetical protein n=1 Tax=Streptomyces sp. NPDC058525 TaxID=3346538 RepID=UPI00365FEBB7